MQLRPASLSESPRTSSAIPSPPTSSRTARTFARCKRCSAMPVFQPRKSTLMSPTRRYGRCIKSFIPANKMKIISWNINGIRAVHKKGLLTPFVEKYNPDIMCFQETKAEQNQIEVDLPEYEEYWNSAARKGYSGTAIFTKIKPLSVINDLPEKIVKKYNLGEVNTEGRVIAAEYKDFFLVNVYTPNSKDDLSRIPLRHKIWDPAFLEYIKSLETGALSASGGKPVIFCGDLNVAHTPLDLARPKENEGRKGFTLEEW